MKVIRVIEPEKRDRKKTHGTPGGQPKTVEKVCPRTDNGQCDYDAHGGEPVGGVRQVGEQEQEAMVAKWRCFPASNAPIVSARASPTGKIA